jgi:hypothetical protein
MLLSYVLNVIKPKPLCIGRALSGTAQVTFRENALLANFRELRKREVQHSPTPIGQDRRWGSHIPMMGIIVLMYASIGL